MHFTDLMMFNQWIKQTLIRV